MTSRTISSDKDEGNPYTPAQRKALHLWCEMVAETLNASGLDMRVVLKPTVAINWSKDAVKENLYKPILKAATAKESTEEQSTVEPDVIVDYIVRHLGDKFGVTLPAWPDRFTRGQQ